MKYPIGIQSFEQIIEDDYVYLDKTALVYDLVTNGKIYFLSRPRRFGKSLLVSTLKCYFEGKKELFKGLAIDKLEKEWKQYPVFHLSFGGQNFVEPYALDKVLEEFVAMAERIYGREELAETLGSRFKAVLGNAHKKTGMRAVVLIDEYDKPLLDVMDMDLSAICCIFPGIAHILYLLQSFLCRTITLEFEDVDIVRGLNHTIYPTFALLLFDEDRETADHSQYEIEGVLEITFLLSLIVLTTLAIRNAGKEGSHQILQLMAISLRHHIYYLDNPGIR